MSIQTVPFTCPHCKNERAREVISHINTARQPEMRQQVQDFSCFQWRCPICGRTSLVVDACLYHDVENAFMVWLWPEEGEPPHAPEVAVLDGYTLRRVPSLNAFREKITILEQGFHDGAIEMMKVLLYMQLSHGMDVVELLFHAYDERRSEFRFVAVLGDGAEQYVSMPAEVYRKMARDIHERLFIPQGTFSSIDMQWASDALLLLKESES